MARRRRLRDLLCSCFSATASEQPTVIPTAVERADDKARRMYELDGFGVEHVSELLLKAPMPERHGRRLIKDAPRGRVPAAFRLAGQK